MSTVCFIGIGRMGRPMATHLSAAGHAVTVCDLDRARAQSVADELGPPARAADGPDPGHDVVVTMLPTSADVASALAGARLGEGTLVIEMSSGEPAATRALAAELAGRGVGLVDAPVSGGVRRAETAELTVMCGGDAGLVDRAEPLLKAMGSTIFRTGPVGTGHAAKALNNLVSAGGLLLTVEAMLMGRAAGLEPELLTDVLNASTGMTNSSRAKVKQFVLSGRYDSGFALDLMVKDLGIALGVGSSLSTPLAALCHQLWQAAGVTLGPGQDHTAIARFSEGLAGTALTHSED